MIWLHLLSQIFFFGCCILLTASLIAELAMPKNKQNKIDQKSMEFQDKINKCHVSFSFFTCSSLVRCMLRKQHHLVNGNGTWIFLREMLQWKILTKKFVFLLVYFRSLKKSCERKMKIFLWHRTTERHRRMCRYVYNFIWSLACCKTTLRNLQFWFIKQIYTQKCIGSKREWETAKKADCNGQCARDGNISILKKFLYFIKI